MQSEYYQRNLPHWHPAGAVLSLTARLHGSLPASVIAAWQAECDAERELLDEPADPDIGHILQARQFVRFDALLAADTCGPHWLADPFLANLLLDSLRRPAPEAYELLAATVMSNHWHAVVVLAETPERPFIRTLQQLKAHVAREANRHLCRSGQFWARETYDHIVRDPWEKGIANAVNYVLHNPVKAGLCSTWEEWPHTWLKPDYRTKT